MQDDLYLVNGVDYAICCRKITADDGGVSNTDALGEKKSANICWTVQTCKPIGWD